MGRLTKQRKQIVEEEMDITPMIDCTFLLLIFFLVASRIDTQVVLDLPPAKHASAVLVEHSVVLTVTKGSGDLAAVYQGDTPGPNTLIPGATAADQDQAITSYVEKEIANSVNKKFVLIKAEGNVKHREVARVAKAASQTEFQQLYVGVMEQQ